MEDSTSASCLYGNCCLTDPGTSFKGCFEDSIDRDGSMTTATQHNQADMDVELMLFLMADTHCRMAFLGQKCNSELLVVIHLNLHFAHT